MTMPFSQRDPMDVQLAVAPSEELTPLQRARGIDYPDTSADPTLKQAWVERMYRRGTTDALARYKQATFNILYFNGRQWLSWKKSQQNWEDLPLPVGDFRITANYIKTIIYARLQRLTSSEVNWRAIPKDNSYHERDKSRVAINFLRSRFGQQKMEQKVRAGLLQASMTGFTALKSFWNPNIGPLTPATNFFPVPQQDEHGNIVAVNQVEHPIDQNGQPVQDISQAFHYRPGDTDTALRTVFNVRLNPEAVGWTVAEGLLWLVDSDVIALDIARERWPQFADKIEMMDNDEAALTFERIIAGSATQKAFMEFTTSPYAGSTQSQLKSKLTVVREYWELPSTFFPQGRLITTVGKQVVYDGPFPQGVFPYTPLFGDPGVMMPYGRPPVNDLISPQDTINREYTAIAREMWSSGTGKYVAWAIPGVPDQISKNDDEVVTIPMRTALMNRSINDVFQRIPVAQVSPDRWHLIQDAKATMFDIGNYHEVSRGQIPPGLDSGVAIQYLLEQESAQLKDAVEALRSSLIAWARHQLAIARWGYGDDQQRWIPVDRPDLDYSIESMRGIDLPDPETMGLDIEYFRPHSEAASRAEIKDLLGMGMIDPKTGLKALDLGGDFENAFPSQTRHYNKAAQENLVITQGAFNIVQMPHQQPDGQVVAQPTLVNQDGSPMLLPFDDDHEIHIDTHNEIALDVTQPWPVRQVMLQHIAMHREIMQQLMFNMAQQQANAGNPYTPPPPPEAALAGHASLNRPNYAATHGGK